MFFFIRLLLFGFLARTNYAGWTYSGHSGPEHWCVLSDQCCGRHQSPIDLIHGKPIVFPPFQFKNYGTPVQARLYNTGHSIAMTISEELTPTVSGGGLNGTYVFEALHFHWGDSNEKGSEHSLGGVHFPIELHIVHYNSKFEDIAEAFASGEPTAIAVLGVFFSVKNTGFNDAIEKIVEGLDSVRYKHHHIDIRPFNLRSLLPHGLHKFYRYYGSLTTPTCDEIVVWTIFTEIGPITEDELEAFRNLLASENGYPEVQMVNNNRPPFKLNNRVVYDVETK